jgi:2',3'-cyclic-nucleotide 2'-phosphodiesterase (5'-nucleotidase family)
MNFSPVIALCIMMAGLLPACRSAYIPQSPRPQSYRITDSIEKDAGMDSLVAPYRREFVFRMSEVIGETGNSLEHGRPESVLGNFLVDGMLEMAVKNFGKRVDVAVLNHGGIRVSQLPAGKVTIGKLYEIMPFDNILVLQEVPGEILRQFLDLVAEKGGWPLANVRMKIKERKAVDIMVGGKPLDITATYIMALGDYTANGGDNADMLRPLLQHSKGYLVRDAFIDYIRKLTLAGEKITGKPDQRIRHAE